jgi:transposase-like protein
VTGLKKGKQPYSRYSKQTKLEAVRRVLEEEQPVQEVILDLDIRHRDNVYEWIKKYKKEGPSAFERSFGHVEKPSKNGSIEKQLEELKMEVETLKTYLQLLLQGEEEKYKAIETLEGHYPIDSLCNALDVPKGDFLEYRQRTINN